MLFELANRIVVDIKAEVTSGDSSVVRLSLKSCGAGVRWKDGELWVAEFRIMNFTFWEAPTKGPAAWSTKN